MLVNTAMGGLDIQFSGGVASLGYSDEGQMAIFFLAILVVFVFLQ